MVGLRRDPGTPRSVRFTLDEERALQVIGDGNLSQGIRNIMAIFVLPETAPRAFELLDIFHKLRYDALLNIADDAPGSFQWMLEQSDKLKLARLEQYKEFNKKEEKEDE